MRNKTEVLKLKKILITGIDGFAGGYMARLCLEKGAKVYGTTYKGGTTKGIDKIRSKLELFECDISDAKKVAEIIKKVKPDWIVHLAAQTFVPDSWKDQRRNYDINLFGTINIMEAVRSEEDYKPRILIACAANEYGHISKDDVPITEKTLFNPDNPYAVSKVAADMAAYQYFFSHKLDTIRMRAFSHTGPEQDTRFVASDFAKQIADIEKGKKDPVMKVGNLEAKRDFTDVRDVVRGYWMALEKAKPGNAYNICSGDAMSIQSLLDILLKNSKVKIKVEQDPNRMRPSDLPIIVGSFEKLKKDTGWQPEIGFEQTLKDILDYWRSNEA